MKYIIDINALQGCLDLISTPYRTNGKDLVYLKDVKELITAFPKEEAKEDDHV